MTGAADWPLVLARFALYGASGLSFGLGAFGLYALRGGERRTAIPLRAWLTVSAAAGLILSAVLLVVMAGVAPPGVGAAWITRTAALALVLVATGLVSSRVLVGPANVGELGASPYGRLLLVKLSLFGAMLGLADLNRFRLTPAFARARRRRHARSPHAPTLVARRRDAVRDRDSGAGRLVG